jgi:hypothetical protein
MVIALSADVRMLERTLFGVFFEEGSVEPVLQDRSDGSDGTGPNG